MDVVADLGLCVMILILFSMVYMQNHVSMVPGKVDGGVGGWGGVGGGEVSNKKYSCLSLS